MRSGTFHGWPFPVKHCHVSPVNMHGFAGWMRTLLYGRLINTVIVFIKSTLPIWHVKPGGKRVEIGLPNLISSTSWRICSVIVLFSRRLCEIVSIKNVSGFIPLAYCRLISVKSFLKALRRIDPLFFVIGRSSLLSVSSG